MTASGHQGSPVVVIGRDELAELIRAAVAAERETRDDRATSAGLLDANGIAAHLGVSTSTVHRLRRDGMPVVRVLESVRFDRDAVVAWLKAREDAA